MAQKKKEYRKDEVTDHTYLKKWCGLGTLIGLACGVVLGLLLQDMQDGLLLGAGCGLFFGSSRGLKLDSKAHYEKHLGD